ncbi:hypothetical protein BHU16_05050 [Tannerella sp. oral taxon 808]|nr:hypothetical protein BHU16_05050 [Tannerella sp. oral taxon 808]
MKELKYKNYRGSIEYSEEDKCLFGEVQDVPALILYEGQTLEELEADFRDAIDDYLELCAEKHYTPERPEAVVA